MGSLYFPTTLKYMSLSDLQDTLPYYLLYSTPATTLPHHYPFLNSLVWFTPTVPYLFSQHPSVRVSPRYYKYYTFDLFRLDAMYYFCASSP